MTNLICYLIHRQAIVLLVQILLVQSTLAAIITVDSTADKVNDGKCTLREAIQNANNDSDHTGGKCLQGHGNDIITSNFNKTIELTDESLNITSNIKFQNLHLKNANFLTDNELNKLEIVAFENVTFEGGKIWHFANNLGSLINLLIKKCFFQEFGGIIGGEAITVENSIFYKSTDRAITFSSGGLNYDWVAKQLTIKNSTFEENQGGAISIGPIGANGIVEIANSTFLNNFLLDNSEDRGSAIYIASGNNEFNPIIIINSTFHGNSCKKLDDLNKPDKSENNCNPLTDAAIFNQGFFSSKVNQPSNSYLHVINSTFSQNGAGIFNDKYYNEKSLDVIEGILTLKNTIIANSTDGKDCYNKGTIAANLNNFIGDGSCEPRFSGDPKLAPLQDNGGPTQTQALLDGSPAIDMGDNDSCPKNDQRGFSRPLSNPVFPITCDIGAVEMLPKTCQDSQISTYSFISKQLTVPFVDIPILDDDSHQPTNEVVVYEGKLQMNKDGTLKVLTQYLKPKVGVLPDPNCHAVYSFENKTLALPLVKVPSSVTWSWSRFQEDSLEEVWPLNLFEVTLEHIQIHQILKDSSYFLVEDYQQF